MNIVAVWLITFGLVLIIVGIMKGLIMLNE